MRIPYIVVVGEGISLFVVSIATHVFPSFFLLIAILLLYVTLSLTLLVMGILGVFRWRKLYRSWILPCFLCIVSMVSPFFAAPIGIACADRQFKRHLNEYARAVQEVRDVGLTTRKYTIVEIKHLPLHVSSIRYARCDDGGDIVEFLSTSNLPLFHAGYVFKGYAETSGCVGADMTPERTWPYVRHVSGEWYHFADVPGL